ncbi:hypothetical protein C2E23DRAFT_787249 [Lenzites betulinus]|nr:hypothetical protein C2E23DRAFT_787249 [Lenzites betulinus]
MVQVTSAFFFLATLAMHAQGLPLNKRIAQVIADSTAKWEQACLAAGGAEKCNPVSVTAFTTLLAAAGPCDQQNSADAMIDLAKTLNNDADMIKFSQIFAQQARNTPNSLAVPYCQQAPKNAELNGLFQCQYQGANQSSFVGGLTVGAVGTIPFGHSAPLSPLGSCPANPSGPIADGSQLTDITSDPGLQNIDSSSSGSASDSGSSSTPSATASASASASSASSTSDAGGDDDDEDCSEDAPSATASQAAATTTAAAAPSTTDAAPATTTAAASSSGSFQLQNAKDAQALNAKFATLTADSSCNEGDQACVAGGFAQCVGGKFVNTGCAAPTQCFALPLVNKAGTSIACTTSDDASARMAAAGASGGITGSN